MKIFAVWIGIFLIEIFVGTLISSFYIADSRLGIILNVLDDLKLVLMFSLFSGYFVSNFLITKMYIFDDLIKYVAFSILSFFAHFLFVVWYSDFTIPNWIPIGATAMLSLFVWKLLIAAILKQSKKPT